MTSLKNGDKIVSLKEKGDSDMNYSPLRYPGGKSKIASFISLIIEKINIVRCVYVEPFAGGAGVALSLLLNGKVSDIVINDYDKAIYSMWRAILEDTNRFINLVRTTPLTIDEWRKQKKIYTDNNKCYSLELGFAAFYLNRTNRSGILSAGPIGGYEQTGKYLIDARYNKDALIGKIQEIAKHKAHIHLYNKDIESFIRKYLPRYQSQAFVYFDPPYYNKGKELYKNFFEHNDHQRIADLIRQLPCHWMVTYDDVDEICEMYNGYLCGKFDLNYSLANSGKKTEIMFMSSPMLWPTVDELQKNKIKINLRGR